MIGRALVLRPHLHNGLFGLIFSVEGETNVLALKLSQRSVAVTSADNGNTDSIKKKKLEKPVRGEVLVLVLLK